VYLLLFQVSKIERTTPSPETHKNTQQTLSKFPTWTFDFVPFWEIERHFSIINGIRKFGSFLFRSSRMSHTIIFTRLQSTDLPLLKLNCDVRKIGFVILSDSAFVEKRSSNKTKSITHVICQGHYSLPKCIFGNLTFNLRSLKNYTYFIRSVNSREYLFPTNNKIIKLIHELPKTNGIHPIMISKRASLSLNSDLLRQYLDIFMLLSLIEFRNYSIKLCDFRFDKCDTNG